MSGLSPLGQAALEYARQGVGVHPCEPFGKAPLLSRGFLDRTTDPAIITRWWTRWPDANIGAVPADVGCIALDIDEPEHHELAQSLCLFAEPTYTTFSGKGGEPPAMHRWYRHNDRDATKIGDIIVRSGKGYVLMAPSVHPDTGRVYTAEGSIADAIPLPERAAAALQRPVTAANVPDAASTGPILEGGRHTRLTSYAGTLARTRMSPDHIAAALHGINAAECRPPLPAAEVDTIARDIAAKDRRENPARYGPDPDLSGLEAPDAAMVQTRTIKRTSELLARPREIVFLVREVIPARALVGLWAASNVGKTFLALDLALHIALGWAWQGRAVQQGVVLYVCAEGEFGITSRVLAWCEHHSVDPAMLEDRIVWREVPLNITAANLRRDVAHELALMDIAPSLIVLDTLAANAPPGFDENSTPQMSGMMQAATAMRNEMQTAVMLVHHTGHDQSRERGNYAFRAACDVSLQLKQDGDKVKDRTRIVLRCAKARDFARPADLPLSLTASHGSAVIEGVDLSLLTLSTPRKPDAEESLLRCLADAGGVLTFTEWHKVSPFGLTKFNKTRDTLLACGMVEKPDPDGPYRITDDGRDQLAELAPETVRRAA
jgi:hypothetical protein